MHIPPSSQGQNHLVQQGISASPHQPSAAAPVPAADMAAQEYYRMSGGVAHQQPSQQQNQHQSHSSPASYISRPPSYTSYDANPQHRPPQPNHQSQPRPSHPNHQLQSRPSQQQSPLLAPPGRPSTMPPPSQLSPQQYNQRPPPIQQSYSGPVATQQTPYASRPVPIQYQQPYYPSAKGLAPPTQPFLSPPPEKWQYSQQSHPMSQPYYPAPAAIGLSGSAPVGSHFQQRPFSNPYPGNTSHHQQQPYYAHNNGNVSDHSRESYSDSDGKHHKHKQSHHRRKHRHSDAGVMREKSPRPHKNRDRFFGASTGALLGDIFIAPGVGTAMGALLGGFGGDSYNKNKNKERQSRKDRDRDRDNDYGSRSRNR